MSRFTKLWILSGLFGLGSTLFVGCMPNGDSNKAPEGFAIVREHVIEVPRNSPPIHSKLDFTIVEVDGGPVTREKPPALVDMQPGALVSAGFHRFRASVTPHLIPAGYKHYEVFFGENVESGKVYFLVDKDGSPILVESRIAP